MPRASGSLLRSIRGLLRSARGQASVLIATMMMTFILFFAFVVNIGMLVNAKINIQNAADLAAYAGAAVQARQLTHISYLNYEMRRQYKKFLFRYYVIGNMAQAKFPRTAGGTGTYTFSPTNSGTPNYQVPVVCIIWNPSDNYCQVAELRGITIPPSNPLDAINETLRGQLTAIEQIRQMNCGSIGSTNLQILLLWLFNTDIRLERLETQLTGIRQALFTVIKGLTFGLGVIPRLAIIRKRIDTLTGYVNFAPQNNVTQGKADGLRTTGDVAARERTIQAFFSAFHTLGNNTFSEEDIILDELMDSRLLKLDELKIGFDSFAIVPELGQAGEGGSAPCVSKAAPITVPPVIPIAVSKDPKILTYYAIRLSAKAKVMFNPFGNDLVLKAYSAAMPFGSRVGPKIGTLLTEASFTKEATNPEFCGFGSAGEASSLGGRCQGKVPNLPIKESESVNSASKGFYEADVLSTFFGGFTATGQQSDEASSINVEKMERAYQVAMSPNPLESGKYNIINDLGPDLFVKNFDNEDVASFWAPIFSLDQQGQGAGADAQVSELVDQMTSTAGQQTASVLTQEFKDALKRNITDYLGKLRTAEGEDRDGFNITTLVNPFNTRAPVGGPPGQPISLPSTFRIGDAKKVKTSWNQPKASDLLTAGRTGYSVKFIAFKHLIGRGFASATGGGQFENVPQADADADEDFQKLQH